jgi:acyl-CoA reductase-like NAD-dependent aldehyde dehydrogenase
MKLRIGKGAILFDTISKVQVERLKGFEACLVADVGATEMDLNGWYVGPHVVALVSPEMEVFLS